MLIFLNFIQFSESGDWVCLPLSDLLQHGAGPDLQPALGLLLQPTYSTALHCTALRCILMNN